MSGAIDLKHPFDRKDGSGKLETITMRRPKVKDLMNAQTTGGTDQENEVTMFANLCEVSPDDLKEMDMADYQQLQETYSGFLS